MNLIESLQEQIDKRIKEKRRLTIEIEDLEKEITEEKNKFSGDTNS